MKATLGILVPLEASMTFVYWVVLIISLAIWWASESFLFALMIGVFLWFCVSLTYKLFFKPRRSAGFRDIR
jgi:hypothetical protein